MLGRKLSGHRPAERGGALLLSLFAAGVLSVIGLGLATTGQVSARISANEEEMITSNYLASSGTIHARALILGLGTGNYTDLLRAGDGVACTGDEMSTVSGDPISAFAHAFPGGLYTTLVCDDDDGDSDTNTDANGRIRIVVTGFADDGATTTSEMHVDTESIPGFFVNGNLRIVSAPVAEGAGGQIHANGDMEINTGHTPCAEQGFTSSGSVVSIGSGSPATGSGCSVHPGELTSAVPVVEFRSLDIPSLGASADYRLAADGRIYDSSESDVTAFVGEWAWDSVAELWTAQDNIADGTYFSEANISVAGNPGEAELLGAALTFISEGWIRVPGSPKMVADLIEGGTAYSLIAGTDLQIEGHPVIGGLLYAGHQLSYSGGGTLSGQVVVANLDDTGSPGNLVPLGIGGYMEVSGSPSLTYNNIGGPLTVVTSWREVRPHEASPATETVMLADTIESMALAPTTDATAPTTDYARQVVR